MATFELHLSDEPSGRVGMPAQTKHIRAFELRLEANWSSEDVVQMLTPDFVSTVVLDGFSALEPTIKVTLVKCTGASFFFSTKSGVECYRRDGRALIRTWLSTTAIPVSSDTAMLIEKITSVRIDARHRLTCWPTNVLRASLVFPSPISERTKFSLLFSSVF